MKLPTLYKLMKSVCIQVHLLLITKWNLNCHSDWGWPSNLALGAIIVGTFYTHKCHTNICGWEKRRVRNVVQSFFLLHCNLTNILRQSSIGSKLQEGACHLALPWKILQSCKTVIVHCQSRFISRIQAARQSYPLSTDIKPLPMLPCQSFFSVSEDLIWSC